MFAAYVMAFFAETNVQARKEDYAYLDEDALVKQPFEVLHIYRRTDPNFIQGLYFDIER